MELERFDHTKPIDCSNENALHEAHRLLANIHDMALGMISACEDFRFGVVKADTWFSNITGGGGLTELEDELIDIRDWAQEAHVNVRIALDSIESRHPSEDEQ